jgi:hypothetical protein
MNFTSNVLIDSEDLAIDMSSELSQEELIDFVMFLDMQVADWAFTEKLYKFFKDQHKLYKQEVKDFV